MELMLPLTEIPVPLRYLTSKTPMCAPGLYNNALLVVAATALVLGLVTDTNCLEQKPAMLVLRYSRQRTKCS
jgi:hypothetical protein